MQSSAFLAKLIGPIALAIGIALIVNARTFRALAEEFLNSRALIYLAGIITMPVGLAIVLNHNVWTADWRVVITVIGWLATIGGAIRLIAPQQATALGRKMFANPAVPKISAAFYFAVGVLLCFFGYFR